jgi:hypothetical protein
MSFKNCCYVNGYYSTTLRQIFRKPLVLSRSVPITLKDKKTARGITKEFLGGGGGLEFPHQKVQKVAGVKRFSHISS